MKAAGVTPKINAAQTRAGPSLVVLILTYNEEIHIQRAIASVSSIATEIVVIDSFSSDRTVAIAEALGARVVQHPFVNQAIQMQWAIDNVVVDTDWVMRLDADEVIEPDLAEEIRDTLPELSKDVTGVVLNRKHIFMGRFIRHGGRYPMYLLRIWRRGYARVEQRWMDEHIMLISGRAIPLEGGFCDSNLNDITYFVIKHNNYATREAIEILNEKLGLFESDGESIGRVKGQATQKKMLKTSIYNRLDPLFASVAYFIYRYFLKFGFLDGKEGLIYHFLQGFWYRFLVGAKVVELQAAVDGLSTREEVLSELSRRTGHSLVAES
jgi:glycosyltransferase involved in cell wall biosynthesis